MTWLTAAIGYGRAGYDVFPCWPGTKHPIPPDGFHSATRDAKTLTRWGLDHPDANLAVRTGRGVSVVDLDALDAERWFEDAMAKAGLDWGPIACTPRGGLHIWFADPAGRVKCRAGKVDDAHPLTGFDVRGVGGYVVVPPSHTAQGVYGWVAPSDLPPPIDALPPWPEAVVPADPHPARGEAVNIDRYKTLPADDRRAYLKAALASAFRAIEQAPEGTRNMTLNSETYSLARLDGLDHQAVAAALVDAAVRAGLPRHEAERTVRSAYQARNPKGVSL